MSVFPKLVKAITIPLPTPLALLGAEVCPGSRVVVLRIPFEFALLKHSFSHSCKLAFELVCRVRLAANAISMPLYTLVRGTQPQPCQVSGIEWLKGAPRGKSKARVYYVWPEHSRHPCVPWHVQSSMPVLHLGNCNQPRAQRFTTVSHRHVYVKLPFVIKTASSDPQTRQVSAFRWGRVQGTAPDPVSNMFSLCPCCQLLSCCCCTLATVQHLWPM